VGCFANNFKISDDCILGFFIVKERNFRHVFNIAVNSFNGFDNMFQVIRNSQRIFLSHRGCASFRT
jgi:hypothetical protein